MSNYKCPKNTECTMSDVYCENFCEIGKEIEKNG